MKKSVFLSVILGAATAFSAPMYFTFTGKVTLVPQDQGGYAAAHGIARGSAVTYVFKVDTALDGYSMSKGVKTPNADNIDSATGEGTNYFFDSLIVPSLFSDVIHDSTSGEYFGYANNRSGYVSSAIQTIIGDANRYTQVILYLPGTTLNFLPQVGDTIRSTEGYTDSSTASADVSTILVCTAIGDTPPASIGNFSRNLSAQSTIWAGLQGGSLMVQNHSGRETEARILNAAGRTTLSLLFNESVSLPVSGLPKGLFVLQVGKAGQSDGMSQAFRR